MPSNKFKAAGYKITVKPCKASPPTFIWPPVAIIAHYQLQATIDGEPITENLYLKLHKTNDPPNLVYQFQHAHPDTGPSIEIYANTATNLLYAECLYEKHERHVDHDSYTVELQTSKTALYDFEEWQNFDTEIIYARLRFWL